MANREKDSVMEMHKEAILKIFHELGGSCTAGTVDDDEIEIDLKDEPVIYFKEIDKPPKGWKKEFRAAKDLLTTVGKRLAKKGDFYPPEKDIFRAFHEIALDDVKVVFLGQDPYPQRGYATGLSFSVSKKTPVPGSLKNIYAEIQRSYPDFQFPDHGDLSAWSQQGIMLLNSCLTVAPGEAGSHMKDHLWKPFMIHIIRAICNKNPNAIFVMWGQKAQELAEEIGEKNPQLTAAHPSNRNVKGGFAGCGHFLEINKLLLKEEMKILDTAFKKGNYKEIKALWDTKAGVFLNLDYWKFNCRMRIFYNVLCNHNSPEVKKMRELPGYQEIEDFVLLMAEKEIDWTLE